MLKSNYLEQYVLWPSLLKGFWAASDQGWIIIRSEVYFDLCKKLV